MGAALGYILTTFAASYGSTAQPAFALSASSCQGCQCRSNVRGSPRHPSFRHLCGQTGATPLIHPCSLQPMPRYDWSDLDARVVRCLSNSMAVVLRYPWSSTHAIYSLSCDLQRCQSLTCQQHPCCSSNNIKYHAKPVRTAFIRWPCMC